MEERDHSVGMSQLFASTFRSRPLFIALYIYSRFIRSRLVENKLHIYV